jgi:hypothetical protein
LGGGLTDFAAFLQHAGVPALDLEFGGGKGQNLSDQEVLITSCEWLDFFWYSSSCNCSKVC